MYIWYVTYQVDHPCPWKYFFSFHWSILCKISIFSYVFRDQTNSYPWHLFPLCTMCSSSVKSLTQSFHDLCKFVDAWRCIFEQNWWFLLTSVLSRYPVVQPQNLHTTSIASSGVPCCKHDCLVAFQHNLQNICLSLPSTQDVLQHILLLLLPAIPNTWDFQPPKKKYT